jgi:hypothetical protein
MIEPRLFSAARVACLAAWLGGCAHHSPAPTPPPICEQFHDVPTVTACAEQTVELSVLPTGETFDRAQLLELCITTWERCAPVRAARREHCKDHFCGGIP